MKDDTPDVIAILDDARLEEIIRLRVDNAKLREACEALLSAFEGYEMLAALDADIQNMARDAIKKEE